jgi:hypothetical protein
MEINQLENSLLKHKHLLVGEHQHKLINLEENMYHQVLEMGQLKAKERPCSLKEVVWLIVSSPEPKAHMRFSHFVC